MSFVLGGLLQGLGSGLSQEAAQRRENSLMAARRKWQLEDQQTKERQTIDAEGRLVDRNIASEGRAEMRDIAAEDRKLLRDVGLLELSQKHQRKRDETLQQYKERLLKIQHNQNKEIVTVKGAEARKTEGYKAGLTKDLERFKFGNERELARFKSELDDGKVDNIKAADDGTMIVTYKDGRVTKRPGVKLRENKPLTGGILADVRGEGGVTPKSSQASSAASTAASAAAKAVNRAPEKTPAGIRAAQSTVDKLFQSGQLAKGANVGDKITAPAGAVAAVPIELEWNGQKWVYAP